MSDRYNGFVVTLGESIKDEDAGNLINCIKTLRGVIDVRPVVENTVLETFCARQQIVNDLVNKVLGVLYNE